MEKRKDQVYFLHFEKGQSALKIADTLGVNRNTINEDIKYWNNQIATQFGRENLGETFCRQIERLNIQRRRLLEEIEKQDEISKKIRLEKLLFDIDYKTTGIITKVLGKNFTAEDLGREEISEEEISNIVRKICLSGRGAYPESIQERDILIEVILTKECDETQARNFFECLRRMGLGLFEEEKSFNRFDLMEFAVSRKIITLEEQKEFFEKRKQEDKKEKSRLDEIENRYKKMYGLDESKWPKTITELMKKEMFG